MTRLVWKEEAGGYMGRTPTRLVRTGRLEARASNTPILSRPSKPRSDDLGYRIGAAGDRTEAWRRCFVLSLENFVRDLPPNNLDAVQAAIKELELKDIELTAKADEGRVDTSMCKFRRHS
ncbi:hypothetical protein GE21DRAFT_8467 [Neurospora crassa]|uniref:Uncharacterized protein n=2 Tax=Neurospora crassa TaxID=5141 RepID=Q1K5T6_NEUCR|nr:hypothetical protein NCU07213 [Neurospora crassa OR74A]EAA28202.1 hypothetical protein NCU07213 [Neurospora crassa OR74A]KHE85755.1 hypothetical protein GE21DRAFT_8467 [Neurospora crassa]CAD71069.1 hypothetical protein [Neurospora crassa]|eukprot:XP_957438.1 hypothetical protein NCU07213 [Neurospora crassa OR74A]